MHIARIPVVACINFTDALLFLFKTTEEKTTPYKRLKAPKAHYQRNQIAILLFLL